MFSWLKKGGRKERGWKFWLKLIVAIHIIMGVVCLAVYYMIQGNV